MLRSWPEADRLLALAYQKYEDNLCPGCGWPLTYTQHKDGKNHWSSSNAIRCHACTARDTHAEKMRKNTKTPSAVRFAARPTEGMWAAMSDPILTYADDAHGQIGASGIDYSDLE